GGCGGPDRRRVPRRVPRCGAVEADHARRGARRPRRLSPLISVHPMTTTTNTVASDLLERGRARLARAEAHLAQVRDAKAPFTDANVLRPYNEIGIEVSSTASECSLMAEVHPDPEVRAAADTIVQELSAFTTRLGQERPLYDALSALDPAGLARVPARVVDLARRDMRRAGVALADADKERVRTVR